MGDASAVPSVGASDSVALSRGKWRSRTVSTPCSHVLSSTVTTTLRRLQVSCRVARDIMGFTLRLPDRSMDEAAPSLPLAAPAPLALSLPPLFSLGLASSMTACRPWARDLNCSWCASGSYLPATSSSTVSASLVKAAARRSCCWYESQPWGACAWPTSSSSSSPVTRWYQMRPRSLAKEPLTSSVNFQWMSPAVMTLQHKAVTTLLLARARTLTHKHTATHTSAQGCTRSTGRTP